MRRTAVLVVLLSSLLAAFGLSPASASTPSATGPLLSGDFAVTPSSAGGTFTGSAGHLHPFLPGAPAEVSTVGVGLWRNGTLTASRPLPPAAQDRSEWDEVFVAAGGDRCDGVGPQMVVVADGVEVLRQFVDVEWGVYKLKGTFPHGIAHLGVSYSNELRTGHCDRGLKVYAVGHSHRGETYRTYTAGPLSLDVVPAQAGFLRETERGAERVLQRGATVSRTITTPALPGWASVYLVVDSSGYSAATPWCDAHPPVLETRLDGVLLERGARPRYDGYYGGRGYPSYTPRYDGVSAGRHRVDLSVALGEGPEAAACHQLLGVFSVGFLSMEDFVTP